MYYFFWKIHPILCSNFFDLQISWYSCWVFLGWVLSFLYFDNISKSLTRLKADYYKIVFFIFFFLGSRLGFYIEVILWGDPSKLQFVAVQEGGFSGQVGGIIAIIVISIIHLIQANDKLPLLLLLDYIAIAGLPSIVCTRIGNFFNHESLGIPTTRLIGVIFSHATSSKNNIPLHPVQLYEAAGYLLGYSLVLFLNRKDSPKGEFFSKICLIISLIRFVLEYLKEDIENGFPSPGQCFSLPFLLAGILLTFRNRRKKVSIN
ncbi:prolipoprotein diacylglyceryl transferase [Candidatus Similichlamydia epinepheli]|uniref:prolipoprotein diacylglyceryl transferase n=1 Tax=Candidatus Similichlamydia epinepheli TaxID=1903953 RepID=UPI000D3AEAA9|nr:prolipoprotein diacylglyceryl transferase family protein [Candidatus Similichlamydia epinepheli]